MSNQYVIVVESGQDGLRGVDAVYGNDGQGFTADEATNAQEAIRAYLAGVGALVNPTATVVTVLNVPPSSWVNREPVASDDGPLYEDGLNPWSGLLEGEAHS
jgi:hypothetical protein